MSKIFIVYDLEATCYDKNDQTKPKGFQNEIIEIGAVKCDEHGNVIDQFCQFLRPKKYPIVSKFCTDLTTITQDDINFAMHADIVIMEFFRWAYDTDRDPQAWLENTIFISWGLYDKRQMRDDLRLNGLNVNLINDDNHRSLKHLHSEWNKLNYPKGVGLGSACKFEKIEFTGQPHRGIDDARNVAKIFKKYIDRF